MFLHDLNWSPPVPATDQDKAILTEALRSSGQLSLLDSATPEQRRVQVEQVRQRKLSCYPGWRLYEFDLDLKTLRLPGAFEQAAIYVLVPDDPKEARLLNGESRVIHELNGSKLGVGDSSPLKLVDSQTYEEYLRFFCLFIAAEEGPFIIIDGERDVPWEDEQHSFEELLERKRKPNWDAPPFRVPQKELQDLLDAKNYQETWEKLTQQWQKQSIDPKTRKTEATQSLRALTIEQTASPEESDVRFQASADVLYGRGIYRASFEVDPGGNVKMSGDEALGQDLPIKQYSFHSEVPVLSREGERETLQGDALEEKLEKHLADAKREPLTNYRFEKLDLSGRPLPSGLKLRNVIIEGDLNLNDARSDRSIELEDVRVVGRLHAKHLVCHSELKFDRLQVFGYYPMDPRGINLAEHVGFSLRGAKIRSTLSMPAANIWGGVELDDIEVDGSADLSGLRVDRRRPRREHILGFGLSAKGGHFKRGLSVAPFREKNAKNKTAEPKPASFVGGLNFKSTTVEGDLDLERLQCSDDYFNINLSAAEYRSLYTGLISAGHEVRALYVSSDEFLLPMPGTIDLSYMTVGGAVSGTGVSVQHFSAFGAKIGGMLDCSSQEKIQTRIGGGLVLGGATIGSFAHIGGAFIGGSLDATGAKIGGALDCSSQEKIQTRIGGDLFLMGATIGSFANIGGAFIGGSVNAVGATIVGMLDGDLVHQFRTQIQGDLDLSGATIASDVRFCSATIKGMLRVITGKLGRVQLRAGSDLSAGRFVSTSVGGILIQSISASSLDLYGIQIDGQDENDEMSGSITIYGSTLADHISFFRERPDLYSLHNVKDDRQRQKILDTLPANACHMRAFIKKDIKLVRVTAAGAIDITNIKFEAGQISLEDVTAGSLTARCSISEAEYKKYRKGKKEPSENVCFLNATDLTLNRLDCAGEVDLSGVRLTGSLKAKGTKAGGEFKLAHKMGDSQLSCAEVAKVLDLTSVKAPLLTLSGKTTAVKKSLILDSAEIGKLRLFDPMPVGANLRDLRFSQLEIDGNSVGKDQEKQLSLLLKKSAPFERMAFRTVENILRDAGNDALANSVYRWMRTRAISANRDRWSGIYNRIICLITGFWTIPLRTGVIMLAIAALSTVILSNPKNIQPNIMPWLGNAEPAAKQSPDPEQWGGYQVARLVLHTHVPITLADPPRWKLAENRPLVIPSFRCEKDNATQQPDQPAPETVCAISAMELSFISPATYGLIVKIMFVILWPMLIISLTGLLKRGGAPI